MPYDLSKRFDQCLINPFHVSLIESILIGEPVKELAAIGHPGITRAIALAEPLMKAGTIQPRQYITRYGGATHLSGKMLRSVICENVSATERKSMPAVNTFNDWVRLAESLAQQHPTPLDLLVREPSTLEVQMDQLDKTLETGAMLVKAAIDGNVDPVLIAEAAAYTYIVARECVTRSLPKASVGRDQAGRIEVNEVERSMLDVLRSVPAPCEGSLIDLQNFLLKLSQHGSTNPSVMALAAIKATVALVGNDDPLAVLSRHQGVCLIRRGLNWRDHYFYNDLTIRRLSMLLDLPKADERMRMYLTALGDNYTIPAVREYINFAHHNIASVTQTRLYEREWTDAAERAEMTQVINVSLNFLRESEWERYDELNATGLVVLDRLDGTKLAQKFWITCADPVALIERIQKIEQNEELLKDIISSFERSGWRPDDNPTATAA